MTELSMAPQAYTAGEQFQRERHTLFAREWLLFAASGQIPAVGNFVSHGIGGWPLFAIRGEDDNARGFHNVCRHQNMPVVDQPAGSCELLRCRYHGWSYRIDGAFDAAPERVAPNGPREEFGLKPVELIEQNGFCLVRMQPGAAAAPSWPAPLGRYAGAITTDTDANWKAVIEPQLASADWHFVWPVALIGRPDAGASIVRQIVPRTFLRTRIIDLVFTADGSFADDLATVLRQRAVAAKETAEAYQAKRAAGVPPDTEPQTDEFVRRLAAACPAAPD